LDQIDANPLLAAAGRLGGDFIMSEKKPIIGGIFGTHTEWDENGNVTVKDDFHLRIYWDLWHTGAMKRLKGNMLHVYLTIAMHLDRRGEGWPTQAQIAKLCGINRDTVGTAIKKLVKEGFIEAEKVRSKNGKFDNTVYKIKFVPQPKEEGKNHAEKSDVVKNAQNQHFHHAEKTGTEKPARKNRHGKSDTKEELSFKDPSFKKDFDDDASAVPKPWETDEQYKAFNKLYIEAGSNPILDHEKHYEKFQQAVEKVGFGFLCAAAQKYIQEEGEAAQIVYFLSGAYNNYLLKKKTEKKSRHQDKPSGLPRSLKNGTPDQENEDLDEQQALIRAKLAKLNEKKTSAI
jgi:DNA-binding transcriptional regulator YhcF (GntR family)